MFKRKTPELEPPPVEPRPSLPLQKTKVLVIDDDPDLLRIMKYMLQNAGGRVIVANNGVDGMQRARAEKPDVILTDLAMPKVSGVEVIQTLQKDPLTCGIPIVAVTAHIWDSIAQSAAQVGCAGFIAKPFSAKQLVAEIEKHLAKTAEAPSTSPQGFSSLRWREPVRDEP